MTKECDALLLEEINKMDRFEENEMDLNEAIDHALNLDENYEIDPTAESLF